MDDDTSTFVGGVVEEVLPDGQFRVDIDGTMRICYKGSMLTRVGVTISEGVRVTVRTEPDGIFRGEITQVRPPLAAVPASPRRSSSGRAPRVGLIAQQGRRALRPEDLRIDRSVNPEWSTVAEGEVRVGDRVRCTSGPATVQRVLGKTGNGSRLLELRLVGETRTSFFAAASNVLLEPPATAPDEPVQPAAPATVMIG